MRLLEKSCVITCDKGRWFIQVQQHIELKPEIQGEVKCVGVDPGVRTFATCYSEKEALVVGSDFAKTRLFPLMKQVDNLIGSRQKNPETLTKASSLMKMPSMGKGSYSPLQ